jgi:uncharacterized coiled-coil DUF342 family protein
MSDIVERLRGTSCIVPAHSYALHQEAADEIERLRADRDSWADQADARVKDCVEYLAEIERLHEELLSRDNKLRAKAEEIERLRSLLREGAGFPALDSEEREWKERVREALGNVPDAD